MLGGAAKRAIDLALTLLALPLWLPMLLAVAAWAKVRTGGRVLQSRDCVGYGGRPFKRLSLRIDPPAKVERVQAPGESGSGGDWTVIANLAEGPRAKWRRALERLPQFFNLIVGDMALVGPAPLTREELEPLKTARRYYLSARPGVVGVSTIIAPDQEPSGQYKIYAMAWAVSTDLLILWDALRSLRDRGELWRPGLRVIDKTGASTVIVRQRNTGAGA